MRTFQQIFGKSPFGPVQEHMKRVYQCVAEIPSLFEALERRDGKQVELIAGRISDLEGAADSIKNDIRSHLPKWTLLPVSRRDLLEVLDMQDSIADSAQDVADILLLGSLEITPEIRDRLFDLVNQVVRTCRHATLIAEQLDELLESSFSGPQAEKVMAMVDELNGYEREADRLGTELHKILVDQEGTISPVRIFLWYQVVVLIGDMADYAEKMGNRLRLFIAS